MIHQLPLKWPLECWSTTRAYKSQWTRGRMCGRKRWRCCDCDIHIYCTAISPNMGIAIRMVYCPFLGQFLRKATGSNTYQYILVPSVLGFGPEQPRHLYAVMKSYFWWDYLQSEVIWCPWLKRPNKWCFDLKGLCSWKWDTDVGLAWYTLTFVEQCISHDTQMMCLYRKCLFQSCPCPIVSNLNNRDKLLNCCFCCLVPLSDTSGSVEQALAFRCVFQSQATKGPVLTHRSPPTHHLLSNFQRSSSSGVWFGLSP